MLSDRYKDEIRKAHFDFSGKYKYIALFTNPAFFVRKNLYYGIKSFAPAMKGKVLDFGCGAKPYQQLFNRCTKYIGCDVEISGHDHSNEVIDKYYDGKHLPFENEYFDSVFSSEVFEHVENLEEIMLELNRVVKKGGYMLVTVPFIWKEHEVPYDYRRFTSFGIKKFLTDYGFEIIECKKLTSSFEAISQLRISYIREIVNDITKNRTVRIICQRIIITPMIIMSIILGTLFPQKDNLYIDNIVLCRKISDK